MIFKDYNHFLPVLKAVPADLPGTEQDTAL